MVTLDDLLGHGEANAQAAGFAGAAGICAPESPEDARQVVLGNTDTGIRNGNTDMLAVTEHRHHDPTALGGVAHGVAHEVDDALRDHVGIGLDDIVVTLGLVSKAQAQIAVNK